MTFYSQKNLQKFCWQNFLPKRICSSKTCSPQFPPKKISFQKNCSPFCSPNFHPKEFAPQFFPPNNLLPNIFALHISSHNEILLTKNPPKYFCWRNFLLTRISPPKLGPQNFLSSKVALKRNCSPFCPPPPQFFFHSKEFAPQIFPPKICCQIFSSPYYFSQKIASQIFLPKNLCCPNHFVEQLWHLIVRCLRRFYWFFVICLKIVIEQKKHLDLQYVQGIPLQQLPGS